jgi:hypothetical protein
MQTYTYREVLQRISDLTDLVDVSSMEQKLKRLIYKAAIDSMNANILLTKANVTLEVVDGLAEKPCDLIRLLRVHPVSGTMIGIDGLGRNGLRNRTPMEPTRLQKVQGYDHNGKYIKPSWVRNGYINISYYAVPTMTEVVDGVEVEEIAISYDQLDYCAYEAIRLVLRDEAARGNVPYQIYQEFNQESEFKFNVAVGNSWQLSIDDMESMAWFSRNSQFFNLR